MKLKILGVLMANLLLFFSGIALAEGEKSYEVSGSVEMGIRAVDERGNSAKFQEYRDLKDGVYGNIEINANKGLYYLDLAGENIGANDQYFQLKGGSYGSFKYSFYYNEIPHNYSFGAKTFYTGVGTGNLDYFATNRPANTDSAYTPNISTNSNLWSPLDYATKRKDVGGKVNFSFGTPFFISLEANQIETTGVKPMAAPSGVYIDRKGVQTSAMGYVIEMPEPRDWKTNNLSLQGGYNDKVFSLAIKGLYSKFENDNEYLRWRNPYVTTTSVKEDTSLAPDNDYWNISAQGVVRLPLDTAVAVKGGYSKLENKISLLSTIASATSGTASTSPTYFTKTLGLNKSTFDGDVTYTTASAAITSRPVKPLDVKVYYNYLKKENDSPIIEYTDPASGIKTDSELFKYDKNNAGVDLGFKLPAKTKAGVGYEYLVINRERPDAEKTEDHLFYGELKNSYLNFLTAKVRYQRLERSSEFNNATAGTGPSDVNYIKRFVRRYDATDKTQDTVKMGLEISPLEHLDFGLEYIYKQNDYRETTLGRTKDVRHEFYVDATYERPNLFKLTGFFDYEAVKSDSYHRYISPSGTYSYDPSSAPVTNSYNWSATLTDYSWALGVGGEVPLIKNKLDFILSWRYEEVKGGADFTSQNNLGNPLDISQYDNYRKQALNAKFVYKMSKGLDLTAGYAYEKYKYDDIQYDGYTNVVASPPNTYLTGAYTDSSYEANVFYLLAKYKF